MSKGSPRRAAGHDVHYLLLNRLNDRLVVNAPALRQSALSRELNKEQVPAPVPCSCESPCRPLRIVSFADFYLFCASSSVNRRFNELRGHTVVRFSVNVTHHRFRRLILDGAARPSGANCMCWSYSWARRYLKGILYSFLVVYCVRRCGRKDSAAQRVIVVRVCCMNRQHG